jgi:hypothetical protein
MAQGNLGLPLLKVLLYLPFVLGKSTIYVEKVLRKKGLGIWSWYRDYAVFGDDVVITGRQVTKEWVRLMIALGVQISMHKPLVSTTDLGLEFAKRTYLRGEDVSAVL